MTDRVVDGQGRVWVTATGGATELGDDVNPALIRDWARRRLVTGRHANGRTWYQLAQLRRVEKTTYRRSRPRRRDAA
jgi:hypothetical protein